MTRLPIIILTTAMAIVLAGSVVARHVATDAHAETQTIKRIPLQKFDVPDTPYQTVIGIAEILPNVTIGRHTHPGPESGYVISGSFTLMIEGQASRELKVGDSYQVPPDVVHDASTSEEGATVIATYVVLKGEPLASPAK